MQDRSVEKVVILFATQKVKQLQIFYIFAWLATGFIPLYIANEK